MVKYSLFRATEIRENKELKLEAATKKKHLSTINQSTEEAPEPVETINGKAGLNDNILRGCSYQCFNCSGKG
jgi:hypothetical protein